MSPTSEPEDVREAAVQSPIGRALMMVGLVVVAVSFVLPYATNEPGCLDHCAPEGRYFVWQPSHNPGAPFLLVGLVSSALLLFSTTWRRRRVTWVGAFSGWLGLYLLFRYGPGWVGELYLYGGPELELEPSRWIVMAGWSVLQVGTVMHGLALLRPTLPQASLPNDRR